MTYFLQLKDFFFFQLSCMSQGKNTSFSDNFTQNQVGIDLYSLRNHHFPALLLTVSPASLLFFEQAYFLYPKA